MLGFIIQRFLQAVVVMAVMSVIVFVGVYAIGSALTVEPWRDVPKDEVGFVARMEVSLGVLHPSRIFKITIS